MLLVVEMKIQISQFTYFVLTQIGGFKLTPRGEIEIQVNGLCYCYESIIVTILIII